MKKNFKLSKRDRDEKRRLLLGKESETETTQTNEAGFARANGSARFLKVGRDGTAAATPLSRRMLAIILAIVFVLTVVPTAVFVGLRGHAEDEEIENLGPVTMTVIANGRTFTTAEVPAGTIEENLSDISFEAELPNGCQFEKALLLGSDGTETPISKVGSLGGKDYYSLAGASSTGTALNPENQSLVLVYAAKYNVTLVVSEGGSAETNAITEDGTTFIWGGNDLVIQATPNTDYEQGQITYKVGNDAAKAVSVKDGSATISNLSIYDDIIVSVNFNPVSSYTVQDARYMSGSKYYPELKNLDNHGGTTQSVGSSGQEGMNSVAKGGTAEFYIYSESNTGGNEWLLNSLSINGIDIEYPYGEGNITAPQPFKNGTITVKLEDIDAQIGWKGDNWLNRRNRSVYRVVVTNVHENLEVAYHFKEKQSREIMLKDLRGIAETGAAREERGDNVYVIAETRNYKLTKADDNIYKAYYNESYSLGANWIPSANLYLYRVKPGFNPYSVSDNIRVDYIDDDTGEKDTISGQASLSGNSTADVPVNVIKAASNEITDEINAALAEWEANETIKRLVGNVAEAIINWDSFIRFWGPSNELTNNNSTTARKKIGIGNSNEDLLLQSIKIEENEDSSKKWYAIALKQREETNQQLYLYAEPYQYKVQLDLDGGSITDSRFDLNYLEKAYHTLENGATFTNLPATKPTKEGSVFEGWQLYKDGDPVNDTLYQANEQFPINDNTIAYATGDIRSNEGHTFTLKAIWTKVDEATTTKTSVDVYVQVPESQSEAEDVEYDDSVGKYYKHVIKHVEETQIAGAEAILLNRHEPEQAGYYEIREDSVVAIEELKHLGITGNVPSDNEFVLHWDIAQANLNVKKEVVGRIKATEYPITVTLSAPDDYPFTLEETRSFMSLSNNETIGNLKIKDGKLVYEKKFSNGSETTLFNAPAGWTYTVEETISGKDFETFISNGSEEFEGRIFSNTLTTDDTSIVVKNQRKFDDPNLETDKWLTKTGESTYDLTMEAYATAKTITEESTNTTPLDIALVIDQSGSMGNEDMNPKFQKVPNKTTWTAKEAAGSDITYYIKVGEGDNEKYYPVQSETGPMYESAGTTTIKNVLGNGHDSMGATAGNVGGYIRPHYSIPTNYYTKLSDGSVHKVYGISVGITGRYYAYLFYYKNDSDARNEWSTRYWYAFEDVKSSLTNDSTWNSLYSGSNPKVAFVDNSEYQYTWVFTNQNVTGLYKKVQNAAPNHLYYYDETGKHYLSEKPSTAENEIAYRGELYQVESGTKRLTALQEAVKEFSKTIAENKAETGADHRVAVIGFAGNETPGLSRSDGIINSSGLNDAFDYVNTGIFINGEFRSFKEIDRFDSVDSSKLKTNAHYYIDYGGQKQPIVRIGDYWYRIDKSSGYYRVTPSNYTCYEAHYKNEAIPYNNAFIDVADSNGTINPTLINTIDQFGSYGGTYTSYGMAMANGVFENNDATGRQRIVVVFTDGEPGANGYDEAIAGEAKADSQIAKNTYDAKVYTVGLFVGQPTEDVDTFMEDMSSEIHLERRKVYSSDADWDYNATYYYYDANNGKTYSVKTEYNGESSQGWWTSNNYHVYPKEGSSDTDANHTQFYNNSSGATWNNRYNVDADKVEAGTTYWILNPATGSGYIPVNFEYRWYDSDGYIVTPKASASETGNYQFYAFGSKTPTEDDGIDYYLSASNADSLKQMFQKISESITTTSNVVEFNAENAKLRDIITEDFDLPNNFPNSGLKIEIVNVERYDNDGEPVFAETGTDVTTSYLQNKVSWNSETRTLDVFGFDYAENYVSSNRSAENNKGKKIVVTINGLEPNKTGGTYDSNVDESGLYKIDPEDETYEKFIDAFPVPSISRHQYTLMVEEEDETATFDIDFKFQGFESDGTEVELESDLTFGGLTFLHETGEANWSNAARDEDTIIFEQILTSENNSGVQHGDAIPDNYQISVEVDSRESSEFKYTMKLDNEEVKNFDEYYDMPKSDATINISSTTKKYPVTVIKQVKPKEGDPDYTDKTKKFDIVITLYGKDDQAAPEGLYDGIEFTTSGGITSGTVSLCNDERVTFTVPYGYYISVNEDDSKRIPYEDSYWEGVVEKTENAETDAFYPKTQITELGKDIIVLNTLEAPDIASGILDENNPFGIILAVLAGICAIAGGGTFYFTKRKKE